MDTNVFRRDAIRDKDLYLFFAFGAALFLSQIGSVAAANAAKGTQTIGAISFTPPLLMVGGTTQVSTTATSKLPVAFGSMTPSTCAVLGNTVTAVTVGACTIAANQVGNANYNAAPQITKTLPVLKGRETITFGAVPTLVIGGTVTLSATVSSALPVDFTSSTPSICSVNDNVVSGVSAGSCTVVASQSGNANYNAAPSVAQTITVHAAPGANSYSIVDTNQTSFYNAVTVMKTAPVTKSDPFYGQDAQFSGRQPSYQDNGDGTITDKNTHLMWVKARGSKVTLADAIAGAISCNVGGYTDWRMPNVKELYSIIEFSGADGVSMTSMTGYTPFLDSHFFDFAYGAGSSTATGTRLIDSQDWTVTKYVSTTMHTAATQFGVNFADGHIKGYPIYQPPTNTSPTTFYVRYVRGNANYSINDFHNNGDGSITDNATGLMWCQNDSGVGMDWQSALAWVQAQNTKNYLGHNDWRLPNAKELQSIVDYTRAPDTTASAAINALFNCTKITNEGGQTDYPFYWTGTTLNDNSPALSGVYIAFGRALGWMKDPVYNFYTLLDVHGAGAQRSDPKSGSPTSYLLGYNASGKPVYGRGPQGDVVRITNFVRPVRNAN